jgi:hypothetical protein
MVLMMLRTLAIQEFYTKENLMKKVIALFLVLMSVSLAQAQAHGYYRGGWHGGYGCGGCWVAPALIGGVVGYELARPNTVVVEQPSVVVQQPQTVVQAPPVGYHWQEMVDPQTGVHKVVAVPN